MDIKNIGEGIYLGLFIIIIDAHDQQIQIKGKKAELEIKNKHSSGYGSKSIGFMINKEGILQLT